MLALHGYHKAFVDIAPIEDMVIREGLPAFFVYGTIVGELIAPIFMILGYRTRLAALVVAFNMLMSIIVAHRDIAFKLNDFGGWMIELNAFYLLTAVAVFIFGAGSYSLTGTKGYWK